ncbi:MAG TPA: hypothetical protein PLV42_09075 [bacterium]|nr:hypothetical protein [bacterium]
MKRFFVLLALALFVLACESNTSKQNEGASSVFAKTTAEAPGENCPTGGIKVDMGFDKNDNNVLDEDEIVKSEYVCNGLDGLDGLDGEDGENGQNGDDGSDGSDGADGTTALVNTTDEPAGENCANGGKKIESGLDDDGDGTLDAGEIDKTDYICNGEDGEQGIQGVPGAQGNVGEQGIQGVPGEDGTDGCDAIVTMTDETAGDICAAGGKKIETGEDCDGDGVIDDTPTVEYVCNGEDPACFGNTAPEITSITIEKAPGKELRKNAPFTLFLDTVDADGDALDITFSGMGATIASNDDGTYTVTPTMLGGPFMFGVIVNDGCQVVTDSFVLDRVITSNAVFQNIYQLDGSNLVISYMPYDGWDNYGDTGISSAQGLAIDPRDGKIYSVANLDPAELVEIDLDGPSSYPLVEIGDGRYVYDIMFGPDGTLYGVTEEGLIVIDIATGDTTVISNSGYFDWNATDAITYSEGSIFAKVYGSVMFEINLSSGQISYRGEIDFPDDPDYDFFMLESGLDYNYRDGRFYSVAYDDDYGEYFLIVLDPTTWMATRVQELPTDGDSLAFTPLDTIAPAEVEDLVLDEERSGCNYASLTWTDPGDNDFDFVMITWTPNGPAKPIVVPSGQGYGAIIDESILPETEYTITVRTVDYEGNMSEGVTITATTPACPVIAAPSHLLYLLTGAGGGTKGILYTLNPATLETTKIGDTGLTGTAGLAINPVDGKMYVTSNDTGHLYEINPATAEVIADIGAIGTGNIPDITFGADGTLYGWTESLFGAATDPDDLITIDLTTGAATLVGEFGLGEISWATGLAFDGDTLYVKFGYDIYTVDATTGAGTYVTDFTGIIDFPNDWDYLTNALAISDNGYYYTLQRDEDGNSYLYVIDPDDWSVTFLGDLGIDRAAALEFDKH